MLPHPVRNVLTLYSMLLVPVLTEINLTSSNVANVAFFFVLHVASRPCGECEVWEDGRLFANDSR